MTDISPGWYKDPVDRSVQRYWDGEGWIGDPIPADATPPAGPPSATRVPPKVTKIVQPWAPGPSPGARPITPTARPAEPAPTPQPTPQLRLPPGVPYRIRLPDLMTPHGYPLAPLWARFLARLVDVSLVLVLNVIVNGWFVYQWWRDWYPILVDAFNRSLAGKPAPTITAPERSSALQVVIILLAAALWFAYEVPATANSGQTLGKRLLRIRVVRLESAEPLGFGRAIRRWNPLGLPTLFWTCFGVGFLIQLIVSISPTLDWPLHRGLHDKWAGTLVVRLGERQPAESQENRPTESRPGDRS